MTFLQMTTYEAACMFVFSMEFYHAVAHIMIMCGLRTIPRKDLVRIRFYFLVDALTVFTSSFLLTGSYRWLAVLQILQHLYYFIMWDKTYMAQRIIDWSSLEWFTTKSNKKGTQLDSTLGTAFDVVVHLVMMYAIGQQLNVMQMILAILLAQGGLYAVVFNPKFSWSNPSNMKPWVQKRLGTLPTLEED